MIKKFLDWVYYSEYPYGKKKYIYLYIHTYIYSAHFAC